MPVLSSRSIFEWSWYNFLYLFGLTLLFSTPELRAEPKAESCPEGRLFNQDLGQCILAIPRCQAHEYLDQLSLTCVPRPPSEAECSVRGLRWNAQTRDCIPKSFQDYCDDPDQPYGFLRTVSCILNRIEAYHCRDAEDYLRKHKSLQLNNRRFRVGSLIPFTHLYFLEDLELENQALTDIEALSQLTKLKRLSLANNAVSDLSPLADLKNLEYLDISGNPISDFSPILGLPRLKTLIVDAERVEDLQKIGMKLNFKLDSRSNRKR